MNGTSISVRVKRVGTLDLRHRLHELIRTHTVRSPVLERDRSVATIANHYPTISFSHPPKDSVAVQDRPFPQGKRAPFYLELLNELLYGL